MISIFLSHLLIRTSQKETTHVAYNPNATINTPKYLTPGFGLAIKMIYPIKQEERAMSRKVERFLYLSER